LTYICDKDLADNDPVALPDLAAPIGPSQPLAERPPTHAPLSLLPAYGQAEVAPSSFDEASLGAVLMLSSLGQPATRSPLDSPDAREWHVLGDALNAPADDWNERFQRLLDVLDSDPALASAKYAALEQLAREFVAVATRHAELIVAEQGLPERLRTIPATNLGGQAGGTKFVRGGILYKLARDAEVSPAHFLYGAGPLPSPDRANKSAAHDLRGASAYFQQWDATAADPLRVPIQVRACACGGSAGVAEPAAREFAPPRGRV